MERNRNGRTVAIGEAVANILNEIERVSVDAWDTDAAENYEVAPCLPVSSEEAPLDQAVNQPSNVGFGFNTKSRHDFSITWNAHLGVRITLHKAHDVHLALCKAGVANSPYNASLPRAQGNNAVTTCGAPASQNAAKQHAATYPAVNSRDMNKRGGARSPAKDVLPVSERRQGESHYWATVSVTPFAAARRLRLSMRQRGMLPDVFQLDTVDGVSSSDFATKLVPPSCSMIWVAVFMVASLTINVR